MKVKQFLDKLLSVFFITFHLFLAVFIIWGLFYLRFLPRVSRDLWHNMTSYQILITVFTICCIAINVYNTAQLMGLVKKQETSIWLLNLLNSLRLLVEYIIDVLVHFYRFVWFVLEFISRHIFKKRCLHYHTLRPLIRSFTNPKQSIYYFYALISLKMLPTIIFVIALSYDVFIAQRFDYTFRCIPLLLIPLLEPLVLFILKDYHQTHVFSLASFLCFIQVPGTRQFDHYLLGDEKDLPYGAKDFDDFFDNHFRPVDQILVVIEKYEAWKVDVMLSQHIQLILQVIRFSAYVVILFVGVL